MRLSRVTFTKTKAKTTLLVVDIFVGNEFLHNPILHTVFL